MKSIEMLINYIKEISLEDNEDIFKNAHQMYADELNKNYDLASLQTYNYWMNKINPNRIQDKVQSGRSSDGYM